MELLGFQGGELEAQEIGKLRYLKDARGSLEFLKRPQKKKRFLQQWAKVLCQRALKWNVLLLQTRKTLSGWKKNPTHSNLTQSSKLCLCLKVMSSSETEEERLVLTWQNKPCSPEEWTCGHWLLRNCSAEIRCPGQGDVTLTMDYIHYVSPESLRSSSHLSAACFRFTDIQQVFHLQPPYMVCIQTSLNICCRRTLLFGFFLFIQNPLVQYKFVLLYLVFMYGYSTIWTVWWILME